MNVKLGKKYESGFKFARLLCRRRGKSFLFSAAIAAASFCGDLRKAQPRPRRNKRYSGKRDTSSKAAKLRLLQKKIPPNEWTGFIKYLRKNYSALVASAAGASPSTAASVVSSSSSSSAPAPPFIAVLDILTATTTALSGCMKLKFSVLMSPT